MKTAMVSRNALALAMNTVKDVIEKRSVIPVLSNVRLVARDGLLLATGTDLDIETTVSMPYGAADAGFAVTIPAHSLADILKKAPAGDDLAIDAAEPVMYEPGDPRAPSQSASLDFGGLRINVAGVPDTEFPVMGMSTEVVEFDISTADFRAGLEAVEFAISSEETRYYLNGIYMHVTEEGALRMVATDGHRLGKHDIAGPFPAFTGVIVPTKCIKHLLKITGKGAPDTVKIMVNHAKVRFIVGNVTVVSKLIDGTFPDYNRVIPKDLARSMVMNRKEAITAVKAVSTVSSERGRAVKLATVTQGNGYRLTLSVSNPDMGTAEFPLTIGGHNLDDYEVGVNANYLLDILQAEDSETVTINLQDNTGPMLFAGRTDYVLMPMRV